MINALEKNNIDYVYRDEAHCLAMYMSWVNSITQKFPEVDVGKFDHLIESLIGGMPRCTIDL